MPLHPKAHRDKYRSQGLRIDPIILRRLFSKSDETLLCFPINSPSRICDNSFLICVLPFFGCSIKIILSFINIEKIGVYSLVAKALSIGKGVFSNWFSELTEFGNFSRSSVMHRSITGMFLQTTLSLASRRSGWRGGRRVSSGKA